LSEELKKEIEKEPKKVKKIRGRTIFVLVVLAIFIISAVIICRADYLETLEIGEEYTEVFTQNMKYKRNIAVLNFIFVFCVACITNMLIKKGLRQFFEEEKREMPKLPNKSLAFVMALVTSLIVSSMFLQKTILFVNAGEFGRQALIREVKEELGIDISNCNINFIDSKIAGESLIVDIFLTKLDVDLNDITIQKEEVDEIKWVSKEELLKLDISTTCQYIKKDINQFLSAIEDKV